MARGRRRGRGRGMSAYAPRTARAHQIAAADPGRSVFVTANAGSGKTSTTLVDRVARLLLREGRSPARFCALPTPRPPPPRCRRGCSTSWAEWAVMDDTDWRAIWPGWTAAIRPLKRADLSDARRLFARALETPGGLKIQTIHAFCEKLLRRFPIEAGVSPAFTVLENEAAIALSHEAREDLARAALRRSRRPAGPSLRHFAVELDWGSFHAAAGHDRGRARQAGRLCRTLGRSMAIAPGPHILAGVSRRRHALEPSRQTSSTGSTPQWPGDAAADGFATGSANDQKIAPTRCARQSRRTPAFAAMKVNVFIDSKGEARTKRSARRARRRRRRPTSTPISAQIRAARARADARCKGRRRHRPCADPRPGPRPPLRPGPRSPRARSTSAIWWRARWTC
jgi:ATP-dependent helicase/nuclease subunit A